MIIFDNNQVSQSFSVVLRDKLVNDSPILSLKLTKLDDLDETTFILTNVSASNDYYTFTVDPSNLEQGEYRAEILQGFGATADCVVNSPETVSVPTTFDCNPLILNDEFVVEALALFIDETPEDIEIYLTKARVEGAEYNTVYTNQAEPEYYVYNE